MERSGPNPDRVRETLHEVEERDEANEHEGRLDTADIERDPAHNPDDENLKDLKGG